MALNLVGSDWREIVEVPLPDAITTSFLVTDIDADRRPEILIGLVDGSIVALMPH